MQSSLMKAERLRFSAASHSALLSRSGERGARPSRARRSVAVDKAEATDLRLRLAFARAPEDQPGGRAHAACEQDAQAQGTRRCHRKIRPQLAADGGRLAKAVSKRVRGVVEVRSLRLDLAPNLGDPA